MSHDNHFDHEEHRAVQADVDAEAESQAAIDYAVRILDIAEILERIDVTTTASAACLAKAGESDTLYDLDAELVPLESQMGSIAAAANQILDLLATDPSDAPRSS